MHQVTKHTLNDYVEFDVPFELGTGEFEGVFSDVLLSNRELPGGELYAPHVHVNAYTDEYGDEHVTGLPHIDGDGWDFYSAGYTAAAGGLYGDPTMHASESIGGKLAQDMITDGGTFAATTVHAVLEESTNDIVGWVVLRKQD